MSDEVDSIEVRRHEAVVITFADGVIASFPVAALRAACPCASCRGWRERGEVAWPRPGTPDEVYVRDAELAGAWGLSIRWSDGHDTGIYAWSVLRRWWDAGLAAGLVIDPVPDDASDTATDKATETGRSGDGRPEATG
jgi:DUF971 family protein